MEHETKTISVPKRVCVGVLRGWTEGNREEWEDQEKVFGKDPQGVVWKGNGVD